MSTYAASTSSDDVYIGENTSLTLTDYLGDLENDVAAKASSTHSHTDLESAIEGLDSGKAAASHTHAQSEITGLTDTLAEINSAITALQGDSGSSVTPMVVASMHLGKLDNNSGAETTSSTRICSDPFAVESGKSYWQVNDKGVNMYVLLYDAEELFLEYMGSFASGAEIAVTNANAAYMRLGSLLGEYDLTNEFRIYDVDPNSEGGASTAVDAYSKDEADARFAPIVHTHDGYAVTDHTHDGYAAASHTHTADDITGLPSSVDAYSKTESDTRFAAASHTHSDYMTESDAVDAFAGINHTHSGYADTNHSHTEYAASGHTHTPASIGAAASSHSHSEYASSSHTHSGYASSSHTHDYLPTSGGTVTGETNFSGGLVRLKGVQTLFHSGSQLIFGSNNLPTRIGGTAITATQTIQVDSDERLKENIEAVDPGKCADFINGINVKTFNYIGNDVPCMGVIAQDIQNSDLAKFFVSTQPEDEGYLAVKAADLVFPLIATVQELSRKVAMLEGNK